MRCQTRRLKMLDTRLDVCDVRIRIRLARGILIVQFHRKVSSIVKFTRNNLRCTAVRRACNMVIFRQWHLCSPSVIAIGGSTINSICFVKIHSMHEFKNILCDKNLIFNLRQKNTAIYNRDSTEQVFKKTNF